MKLVFKVLLMPWLLFTVVVDVILGAFINAVQWCRKESAKFQIWLMRITDDELNKKCISKEKARAETKKAHNRIRNTTKQIFRLWADGSVEGPDDFDDAKTLKYDDYVNVIIPADVVQHIADSAIFDRRELDKHKNGQPYQKTPNSAQTPNLEA